RGKNVVIYNAKYDRKMMHRSDERSALPRVNYKEEATYWCAMEHYAEFWGEKRYGSFTWQKLTAAADQQGVVVENAHDALGDCLMTLGVIRSMAGVEVPAEV
ncbi:MAG: 3'-5' exonuclease, partial [Chloroflexota bacterium]